MWIPEADPLPSSAGARLDHWWTGTGRPLLKGFLAIVAFCVLAPLGCLATAAAMLFAFVLFVMLL